MVDQLNLPRSLHFAVEAVCPIDSVGIGNPNNKATWRVDYRADATKDQKAAADAALASFDPLTQVMVPKTDVDLLKERVAVLELAKPIVLAAPASG